MQLLTKRTQEPTLPFNLDAWDLNRLSVGPADEKQNQQMFASPPPRSLHLPLASNVSLPRQG